MSKLNKDMMVKIALELDLPDLMNLCVTDPEFRRKICDNDDMWRMKMKRDFPNVEVRSIKDTYTLLYSKLKFVHDETKVPMPEIYKNVSTILSTERIMKLPNELIFLAYKVSTLKKKQVLKLASGEIVDRKSFIRLIKLLEKQK